MKKTEPPGVQPGRTFTDWDAVVATAKANPGEWFMIGPFSHGMPYHIRKGTFRQFIDDDDPTPPEVQMRQRWQITSRRVESGHTNVNVYVKWNG